MLLSSKKLFLDLQQREFVYFASFLLCGFKQIFWVIGIFSEFQGTDRDFPYYALFPFLMLLYQTSWWWYSSLTYNDAPKECAAFLLRYQNRGEPPRNSSSYQKMCFLFSFRPGICLFEHDIICCTVFLKKAKCILVESETMFYDSMCDLWIV